MLSGSTGLVIRLKSHFLLLFNLMEEIISWKLVELIHFCFEEGEWERACRYSNCCSFWKCVRHTFPAAGPGQGRGCGRSRGREGALWAQVGGLCQLWKIVEIRANLP